MRSSSLIASGAIAALSCVLVACKTQETNNGTPYTPPPAAGMGGVPTAGTTPGTAGSAGAVTTAGTSAAGMGGIPAAGTGGAAGAAGTVAAGSGGVGGSVAAGSGGTGTAGTDAAGTGGGDLAMCVTDVMTSNSSTDATCAMCMCMSCGTELTAVDGDANAQAMLSCISMADCSGSCCLCNNADCAMAPDMFGLGPCGMQILTAAGVPTDTGLIAAVTNGTMVSTNCAPTGPADQSCADAARLGACISMNCATQCPMNTCP